MPWPNDAAPLCPPVTPPADGLPVTRVHVAGEPRTGTVEALRYVTAADLAGLVPPPMPRT